MTTFPLVCKCGTKFYVPLDCAGKEVTCTGCGKKAIAPFPKKAPAKPAPAVAPAEEDEVKLQPLPSRPEPAFADEIRLQPLEKIPVVTAAEEDEGGEYGLDDNDGMANLIHAGPGMYGTVATIRLDEIANCIAFGSKGDWALAEQGQAVLMIHMRDRKKRGYFEEHDAEVTAVALSATQPLALTGDDDGGLRLWEVPSAKRRKKLSGHDGAVNALALSPNGKYAASGGDDGCVHLWDLATGKRIEVEHGDWSEYDEEVTFVSFSRDGDRFLAGGSEGRVSLWDVPTGKRVKRYPGIDLPISCVRLSQEGGIVTATTQPINDGSMSFLVICHWDTKTGKPINRFNIGVDSIPCCIAPDLGGTRVVIAGEGPWMGAFRLDDGRCMHGYDQIKGTPLCLAISPANTHVLASLDTERLQLFGMEAV